MISSVRLQADQVMDPSDVLTYKTAAAKARSRAGDAEGVMATIASSQPAVLVVQQAPVARKVRMRVHRCKIGCACSGT